MEFSKQPIMTNAIVIIQDTKPVILEIAALGADDSVFEYCMNRSYIFVNYFIKESDETLWVIHYFTKEIKLN